MIDIESKVFKTVKERMSPLKCAATYQETSKEFPLVTVEETDNAAYEKTQDSGSGENHARVLYEINVYSNLTPGKKSQAKEIMKRVDGIMAEIGFYRVFCKPMPNLADSTIYRITARYRAVVDKEENIYWR